MATIWRCRRPSSMDIAIQPQDECVICASTHFPQGTYKPCASYNLPCACFDHSCIHKACFDEWYTRHHTCPCCLSKGEGAEEKRDVTEPPNESSSNICYSKAIGCFILVFITITMILYFKTPKRPYHDDDHGDDDHTMHDGFAWRGLWHLWTFL